MGLINTLSIRTIQLHILALSFIVAFIVALSASEEVANGAGNRVALGAWLCHRGGCLQFEHFWMYCIFLIKMMIIIILIIIIINVIIILILLITITTLPRELAWKCRCRCSWLWKQSWLLAGEEYWYDEYHQGHEMMNMVIMIWVIFWKSSSSSSKKSSWSKA